MQPSQKHPITKYTFNNKNKLFRFNNKNLLFKNIKIHYSPLYIL